MAEIPLPLSVALIAEETPESAFFQMVDEPVWTYAQMHRHGLDWAQALGAHGVKAQARVATMLPTSADAVAAWFGIGWLRAVEAPINLDYQGPILGRVLAYCEPSHIIVHERFSQAVEAVIQDLPERPVLLVLRSGDEPLDQRLSPIGGETLDANPGAAPIVERFTDAAGWPRAEDITLMLFTSGTTGSPKGVLVPWSQVVPQSPLHDIDEPLVAYSAGPMFHTSGRGALVNAIIRRGRIVCRERFSGSQFWQDVKRHQCNYASLMAAFLAFMGQQGLPADAEGTPLRYVATGRVPESFAQAARKLDLRFSTLFNMTEISPPIASQGWLSEPSRSCGKLRAGYECRIVDDFDHEVPTGEPGELIIRASDPWTLMQGYWRRPEETVKAWRNLWFHTGDLFTCDEEGFYYYLDRKEDRIRRRGENISPDEVENAILRHPAVAECAAVGVASRIWDSDIKAMVVRRAGAELDPESLLQFLQPLLPGFMIPRYIEFVGEIPRTPTGKAKRALLRQAGVTDATWDAEASAKRAG